jgi:hypothetical protein
MFWGVDQVRQDKEQGKESYPFGEKSNQTNLLDDHE